MKKRGKSNRTTGGLVLVLGLGAGCGAGGEPQQLSVLGNPSDPSALAQDTDAPDPQVEASIQDSINRLRSIELFSIDDLVSNLPASATACYSLPCPGDTEGWAAYHAERALQAQRVAKFADQAEDCNSGNCYISTPSSAAEAVSALNALQIVRVPDLVHAQPKNNPSCYETPCASDIAAADAENSRRSVVAFTIAQSAKLMGI